MSKMNRTKFNVCVNLQSCCVLFKVYTCAIWMVCVLSLYVGIASTSLFTGFVYSQITLFKVRSVKRVWRINAHFRPLRRRRSIIWVAGSRTVASKSLPGLGCGLSGGVETEGGRREGGSLIWTASSLSYLTSRGGSDFKSRRKTMGLQIEGRKVRASH